MADKYPGWSTYFYAGNNSIIIVDKEGKYLATLIGGIVGGVSSLINGEDIEKGIIEGATS
jgi:hypothetical protein